MSGFSTVLSQSILEGVAEAHGEKAAMAMLDVSAARYASLLAGRGRLTEAQVKQLEVHTGVKWQEWVLAAGGRRAKSKEAKAFHALSVACYRSYASKGKVSPRLRATTRRAAHSTLKRAI